MQIATEMSKHLNADTLIHDAQLIVSQLSTLTGKLTIHLAMEDKVIYPYLINHKDEHVRVLAKKYIDEIGSIAQVFTNYIKKWPNPHTIQDNTSGFIHETKSLFQVLSKRIDKEDNELYELVDRL